MKYINHGKLGLVLFSPAIQHAEMARVLRAAHPDSAILSAGFIKASGVECCGESVSLGLKSTPEDSALLRAYVAIGCR